MREIRFNVINFISKRSLNFEFVKVENNFSENPKKKIHKILDFFEFFFLINKAKKKNNKIINKFFFTLRII